MSPETHLLASWLIAAKTAKHERDVRLITLAGILPDADGLGMMVDAVSKLAGHPTTFYANYHHYLLHGIFGAIVVSAFLGRFAIEKIKVGLLALLVFHLHLLCDLVGSRGPTVDDIWPLYYLGPFTREPCWFWTGQWRLDGWQNRYLSVGLLALALWWPLRLGFSVVGVFNRRADRVFVEVLRKWNGQLRARTFWNRAGRPPWRTIGLMTLLACFAALQFVVWDPGLDVVDGEHDRKRNGIWISHGWLGDDTWFASTTNEPARFRDPARVGELRELLARNHISDVFPHLCPADAKGRIPAVDRIQTERFLDEFSRFRVLPWIGGVNGLHVRYHDSNWIREFIRSVTNLLANHPRFAGIHLNIEPLTSGDQKALSFLDELRAALPKGKLLSIAAYPPPTRWHPYPDVHWDEGYFREIARRSDQLAVMMYDTGLHNPKLYQKLMSDWTAESLRWSEGKPVLLGVPTYDDRDSGYHDPRVENLTNALRGIHAGLAERPFVRNFQGVAIYCEWETDPQEWRHWQTHFLKP